MAELRCFVICRVTYPDGHVETRKVTLAEISAGPSTPSYHSVIDYLRDNLGDEIKIEIIDTLYFKTIEDYTNYLKN